MHSDLQLWVYKASTKCASSSHVFMFTVYCFTCSPTVVCLFWLPFKGTKILKLLVAHHHTVVPWYTPNHMLFICTPRCMTDLGPLVPRRLQHWWWSKSLKKDRANWQTAMSFQVSFHPAAANHAYMLSTLKVLSVIADRDLSSKCYCTLPPFHHHICGRVSLFSHTLRGPLVHFYFPSQLA